jgi:hypothetical protein
MNVHRLCSRLGWLGAAMMLATTSSAGAAPPVVIDWQVVMNNGDLMPTDLCDPAAPEPATPPCRRFNSYNQPSVNVDRLVVVRARSRGGQAGGPPVHGVFTRDMAVGGPVVRVLDRDTLVPQPNNRGTTFIEPPSFPRIDMWSTTVATRGNHEPVWSVLNEAGEIVEQLGTTGIYTNPFGGLITGASKLGPVPAFGFFGVPEAPGTPFDVFPGAPAVTDGATIVFKGNYTVGLAAKTGVYYRRLANGGAAGGDAPVVLIANNTATLIPGTQTVFGSTSPPSAADGRAVFAGFDNEENPTLGGIYLAPLTGPEPPLTTLVAIGSRVPGENSRARFSKLGEGVAFDGRFVAFWGAWGTATRTLVLRCPTEGNAARVAFCNEQYPDGFTVQVPVHQGVFVYDIRTREVRTVAKAPGDFDDFLFWNFSGRVPGMTEGGDDDGEPARWRSSAFVAVSGMVNGRLRDAGFHAAFKARAGAVVSGAYVDPVDGIYLGRGLGRARILTLVETGMDGTMLDPEAVDDLGNGLPVTAVGIERDGFRGGALVINASMGSEETGWAGIYLTDVSR